MDSDLFNQQLLKRLHYFVNIVTILGICVAVLVLIGWIFNIESMKTILPNLASMKVNTAIAFLLLGLGILCVHKQPTLAQLLAIITLLIGFLSLLQYTFELNLGIDELLIQDINSQSSYPGRISVMTALLFCLSGLCLLLTARRRNFLQTQLLSLGVAFIALLSLAGYFYNVQALYQVNVLSSIAIHTAMTFILMSIGLFFAYPQHGAASWILMNRAGGRMAKRFLPFLVIFPLVFAGLILQGYHSNYYDLEFGIALIVLSSILLFTILIFRIAYSLNRVDIERENTLQALKQSNDSLELRIQERTLALQQANSHLEQEFNERRRLEEERTQFFTLSIDMLMIAGFDNYFKYTSPSFETILGYTTQELLEQPFWNFIHPDDIDNLTAQMIKLGEGKAVSNLEIRLLCLDGSYKWIEWTAQPVIEQALVYGIGRDITEKKQAETILEEKITQELKLHTYLKALQDVTIELTNTNSLDGFYKKVVEFGLEVFGFDRMGLLLYDADTDLVLGTYGVDKDGKVIPEHHLRMHSSELTGILRRAVEHQSHLIIDTDAELFSNKEFIGKGWNAVAVLWHGSEKLGWLAIDNGVSYAPITPLQLEIFSLYALSLSSLLVRKQTLHHLEESENRYRSVVSTMSEGVVLQSRDGTIQACNTAAEEILGLTAEQMMGRTSIDPRWRAIHEDGSPFPGDTHPAILSLKTGQPHSDVIMGVHKPDSTLTWILVNSEPMFHPDEASPYAVVTTFTDITQRKLAQQQAFDIALEKERIALMRQFVQDTSHEFRTPLSIIQSSIYIMTKIDDAERKQKKADLINAQIARIIKLVDMLVVLSQLDSGLAFNLTKQDLNYFIEDVCNIQEGFANKELNLTFDFAENMPPIHIDISQMYQALYQLLDNAIRFTDVGGDITVSTQYDDDQVRISITDTGIGISEDALPRIFERFYRQDVAHHTPGFGLGLAIAQKIVERHDGEIIIESSVGEGSTFQIILPISNIDDDNH